MAKATWAAGMQHMNKLQSCSALAEDNHPLTRSVEGMLETFRKLSNDVQYNGHLLIVINDNSDYPMEEVLKTSKSFDPAFYPELTAVRPIRTYPEHEIVLSVDHQLFMRRNLILTGHPLVVSVIQERVAEGRFPADKVLLIYISQNFLAFHHRFDADGNLRPLLPAFKS